MSGNVLCSLVYLGEDGEIGATVLPSKYEFSIPFGKNDIPKAVSATVNVDTINYRLSGPRRLNVRTRLRAKPIVFFSEDVTPRQTPESDENIYKLYGEVDSVNTFLLNTGEITVSDSIPLVVGEEAHLIWCGATAAVSDVKTVDGGVSVRGEVTSKVIMDDGGTMKFFSNKIPFEEFLDGDVSRGAVVCARANVISTEASKQGDDEALTDVVISIEALVDMPCRIPVLKDAFSGVGEGSVDYIEIKSQSRTCSRSGIYNAGASVVATGISTVLDTSGNAILDEMAVNDGKLVAEGRCILNVIYITDENSVASNEYTVPFKITLDGEYLNGMTVFGDAEFAGARARVDSNGIAFDMDISICSRATMCENTVVVEKCDFSSPKPYAQSETPLCVIYSGGESLWSLAKKYHVSPEKLAKINSLDIGEADMQNREKLSECRALMLELK